ncbi:MAG: transcription termination factor NusA [bacterium]
MTDKLVEALEQLVRERGLDRQALINTLHIAFLAAAKKTFGYSIKSGNIEIKEDADGHINVNWIKKAVSEPKDFFEIDMKTARKINPDVKLNEDIRVPLSPLDFTRTAAQTTKQIVIQRIKEAERESIYKEIKKKEGDIATGTVQKVERNYINILLGKVEGILPYREQVKNEKYISGDRIKVYVVEVVKSNKGLQIKLSRSHPGLVRRLFELEVPEIGEKTVEIKNIVREPGERTKIAVYAKNSNIDPVGACVGMKGSRIQAITRELRNEKLDIIPWSENESEFIIHALSPAKITRVILDREKKRALVIVPNDQLSLAIGKKGQNARLSARLTNWKIDVKNEDEFKEVQRQTLSKIFKESAETQEDISLSSIEGVGSKTVKRLETAGLHNLKDIKEAGIEQLESIEGIGKKTAEKLLHIAEENIDNKIQDTEAKEETDDK